MKFEDYTKPQQDAITREGNVIVSAGAGSGKTQVLTERVKYFVKEKGLKLDEFLILTFTKLAAGEMKDRIRKALTEENLSAKDYVDTADICTFDSYALSIVKKYHFMLNVSPDVSIVDSNIISVRKRTIIEDIFEEKYKEEDQEFINMIDRFCFKDDQDLKDLTLKLYDKALLDNDTNAYLDSFVDTYYSDSKINEMIQMMEEILIDYKKDLIEGFKYASTKPCSKKNPTPYNIACMEVLKPFMEATTYEDLVSLLPLKLGIRAPKLDEDEKMENSVFTKAFKKVAEFVKTLPLTKEDFISSVTKNKPYAQVLISIVKELDKRIFAYKNSYQVFEFSDIAKLALNLVRTNAEVRDSIKNKLKMIMIDEYQDTSALQEAFINEIENNNVYMVGDVKQSIYRFRNARCDIFIDKYDRYKKGLGGSAIDLNKNFRSRKEVLSDINYIFKNLMTKEYGGADYRRDHLIEFGNTKYINEGKTNRNNHSEFLFHEKTGLDIPTEEANIICRDIINKINSKYQVLGKDGLRDCKFSDFCILMDRGSEFETYSKIFSSYHIPLYVENDENIKECDIVLILINLLKVIKGIKNNDYKDVEFRKAFIGLARSFFFNYTDDELLTIANNSSYKDDPIILKIKDVLFTYKTYPLSKQFEEIIFKLDVYNKLIYSGEVTKNELYLDMFLDMFKSMSSLDYTLEDFIIYMENIDEYDLKITMQATGSSLDSVKIMNIHKSKGLEFPIIYFAGLYKGFNTRDLTNSFGVSSKYGLILKPETSDKADVVKIINEKLELKEDISERIRLFYVALTRTKEKMIFLVNDKGRANYLKGIINNDIKDEFIRRYDLDNLHILDIANILVDGYLNDEISKDMYLDLLKTYNIPVPRSYEYINSPKFVVNKEELINESLALDDMLKKLESRMLDKKEVVIYLYDLLKQGEATLEELNYCLDKYDFVIENMDDLLDEVEDFSKTTITKDNIINKNEFKNIKNLNDYKYYDLVSDRIEDFINDSLTKDELVDLIKFLGLTCKIENIDKDYLDNDSILDYYEEVINERTLSEDKNQDFKDLLDRLEELDGKDYFYYNFLINKKYINNEEIMEILDYFNKSKNVELRIDLLKLLFNLIGFNLPLNTINLITDIHNGSISEERLEEFNNLPMFEKFIPLPNIKSYVFLTKYSLFNSIFNLFKKGDISKKDFNYLLNIYNYELDIDFINIKDEDINKISEENIFDIISIKDVKIEDVGAIKNFSSCISPFINNPVFLENVIFTDTLAPTLKTIKKDEEYENLEVEDIKVQGRKVEIFRASKNLDLLSSRKNMEFGTRLHFIMETTDLKNPNYSLLNEKEKTIVKRFLDSKLMKNIKEGEVYKEYEFIDEENSTNGIIDLMIIYPTYIDIIDYKTKNIDDESYDKQLKIYKDFALNKFNKPVNTYLYALLTGEIRECK